jgi:pimeloyl-ACP methyl ester carboxylesterase
MDGMLLDSAGRRCGADIIAIDRPGIGRSDVCTMPSIAQWAETVEGVADQLHIGEFAVAGWSGGPYALACAAAMPKRVRAVATLAGMAPLETFRHIAEMGFWPTCCSSPPRVRRLRLRQHCCG